MESRKVLYFDRCICYPIELLITFEMSTKSNENFLKNFGRALGASFTSVHDANLNILALQLREIFTTPQFLQDLFFQHYKKQFIRKAYNLLFGSDILGAPINFASSVQKGIVTFWVEPSKGIVKSPEEFGMALATGTVEAFSVALEGIFGSIDQLFSSVGSGFTVIAMDEEFQRNRQKERNNKPKNVGDGIVQGTFSLGSSVWSGISGIVKQPAKGLENEGTTGLFKGIGKGLAGFVAKPLVGVTDLISNISEGAKVTSSLTSFEITTRFRPPRVIENNRLVNYNHVDSLNQYILNSNERFKTEKVLKNFCCKKRGHKYILYTTRFIIFTSNYQVKWFYYAALLQNIVIVKKMF